MIATIWMLHLHCSDRAEALLEALGQELAANPLVDPMAAELICVPSKGIERWISQGLADHVGASATGGDGVSANVDFPTPAKLISTVIDQVADVAETGKSWTSTNLMWAVARAVDESIDAPWLGLVSKQISAGAVQGRTDRMATMQYIAGLFERYHWQRPEMIFRWHGGEDVDGNGNQLGMDVAWQPMLWRLVRATIGSPSPPEILESAKELLVSRSSALALPARVSMFGLTRVPLGQLKLLAALAQVRDVHLYVLHPSPALWDVTARYVVEAATIDVLRSRRDHQESVRHPLLRSWGKDANELQIALAALGATAQFKNPVNHSERTTTVLSRLQADIRNNTVPGVAVADGVDRSLQIHSCHGPGRQVEVLRDSILHALSDDPSLEPRDIVVMCPDIEAFAPYINATFASVPELRARLADRSFAQSNPYMAATAQLLKLVGARCSSVEVLALLSSPPVRNHFNLSDDDLIRIEGWVHDSGVRWGLSQEHRMAGRWGDSPANTWRGGLNRLALGVAMSDVDNRLVGGARPQSNIESTDVELVGRLTEFVIALERAVTLLGGSYTVTAGLDYLRESIDSLMGASASDAWQRASMFDLLDSIREPTLGTYGESMQVSVNEFQDLFADELVGRPSRANFRSGGVTFCTLTPMRSVPHRVVCLLGMDDDVFPRLGRREGDDITRTSQQVGDYDARSEDRQLLLDAVMAAQQQLIITYSGRNERTNEELRPSVPIDELLTVLETMTGAPSAGASSLVTEHPLQGFDVRNFISGALAPGRSWSFDELDFQGSKRLATRRALSPLFIREELAPPTLAVIEIDELVKFVQHPVRTFFKSGIRLSLDDYDQDLSEDFPAEIDGLLAWKLGTELLAELARDAAASPALRAQWQAATIAAGTVPPGNLAVSVLAEIADVAERLDVARRAAAAGQVVPRQVSVWIPEFEVEVRGIVSCTSQDQILATTMSKVLGFRVGAVQPPRVKPLAAIWVPTLALACTVDGHVAAQMIGKGSSRSGIPDELSLVSPPNPLAALSTLVGDYLQALKHPPSLFGQASLSFAFADEGSEVKLVEDAWTSTYKMDKEDRDRYHLLAFGETTAVELLTDDEFRQGAGRMWNPVKDVLRFGQVSNV